MILSIHQPSYFPWLGLLDKIAKSDAYIVMDEIQLSDSAYQHRNIFLTADGKVKYLTIPFNKKEYLHRPFRDLELTDGKWRKDHLNFIINTYRKYPKAKEILPELEMFYNGEYKTLFEAVIESMKISFKWFNIKTKVILQSDLQYDRELKRGDLVFALINVVGADVYLSGTGAQAYLDESRFSNGLILKYNSFVHPVYSQRNTSEFVNGLSCVDVLFNLGLEGTRSLFWSGLKN